MNLLRFCVAASLLAAASCTKEKTDYQAQIETDAIEFDTFKEVVQIQAEGHRIGIEALNGTFYTGYNEIRLTVSDTRTDRQETASAVTFLPLASHTDGQITSGPHRHELPYRHDGGYYAGYAVFTEPTGTGRRWELYISYTLAGETRSVQQTIEVRPQPNKNRNMTTFIGHDNAQYVIALIYPQKPRIAENELVAGIYRRDAPSGKPTGDAPDPARYAYSEAERYTLLLDPRMPEPSMGNHSSPNNRDLTQQDDGLYHGIVNYTMTGHWTLNFILLNQHGRIMKGTEVPRDFTPGVEGTRSELHIDILF